MIVRLFRDEDAEALTELYRRSVGELGSARYGPDQIRVWRALAPSPDDFRAQAGDGRTRLVAADETDRPLAFADLLPDGFVQYLFRAPDAPREATAQVYEALEAAARVRGLDRLTVHASELARPFLARRGFDTLERREFEVEGVPIHNYAMAKRLASEHDTAC